MNNRDNIIPKCQDRFKNTDLPSPQESLFYE